jgi:hypothetical protein
MNGHSSLVIRIPHQLFPIIWHDKWLPPFWQDGDPSWEKGPLLDIGLQKNAATDA